MARFADYTEYSLWTNNTSDSSPALAEFRKLSASELQAIATIVDRWKSQREVLV